MKKYLKLFLLAIGVFYLTATMVESTVPYYLTYQGILRDSAGNLVTGAKSMTFKIYDASTSGTEKASFGPTSITASNGQYTAQIGLISSPTTVFDGNDRWLEIAVEGITFSPRLKINSVAYAIKADSAASADTVASNITIATSGNISTTGTASAETLKIKKFQTIDSGTGSGFCVGTGSIPAGGNNSSAISNSNVTDNSMIFVAPKTRTTTTYEALTANSINVPTGTFKVGLINSSITTPVTIDFNYLIIN
jgi:hypothetical protein